MDKKETRTQRAARHMKIAASASVSGVAFKAGHTHATARAEREKVDAEFPDKDDVSPEGLASEA